jgi:hypothetical protein
MVLRDHQGEIIFIACPSIPNFKDATEEEIIAIEEGLPWPCTARNLGSHSKLTVLKLLG